VPFLCAEFVDILCAGTVMFQLRRRIERPSSSLRKAGSVDDMKMPRILPAVAQSLGEQITLLVSVVFTWNALSNILKCST